MSGPGFENHNDDGDGVAAVAFLLLTAAASLGFMIGFLVRGIGA